MRKRVFIVLSSRLSLGLSIDLERAIWKSSPALNLATSAYDRVRYEAYAGQETNFESFRSLTSSFPPLRQ